MRIALRLRVVVVFTTALLMAGALSVAVRAQGTKFVGRFTATTAGLNPGAAVSTKIDILRWSTDEESTKLADAFTKDATKWAEALQAAPSVGYLWTASSSLGYSIKLARVLPATGGGARVLLAVERTLGSWERTGWKAAGAAATDYPFTVVELRVNSLGVGTGKTSLAGKVAIDATAKVPAIENFATAPVTLATVKRTDAAAAPK